MRSFFLAGLFCLACGVAQADVPNLDPWRNETLDGDSGIAVMGIDLSQWPVANYEIGVYRVEGNQVIRESRTIVAGGYWASRKTNPDLPPVDFRIAKLAPGEYVITFIQHFDGEAERTLCLANAGYRFRVSAGEVAYVGDLQVFNEGRSVSVGSGNLERAQAALHAYSGIHGDLHRAQVKIAPAPVALQDGWVREQMCRGRYYPNVRG